MGAAVVLATSPPPPAAAARRAGSRLRESASAGAGCTSSAVAAKLAAAQIEETAHRRILMTPRVRRPSPDATTRKRSPPVVEGSRSLFRRVRAKGATGGTTHEPRLLYRQSLVVGEAAGAAALQAHVTGQELAVLLFADCSAPQRRSAADRSSAIAADRRSGVGRGGDCAVESKPVRRAWCGPRGAAPGMSSLWRSGVAPQRSRVRRAGFARSRQP